MSTKPYRSYIVWRNANGCFAVYDVQHVQMLNRAYATEILTKHLPKWYFPTLSISGELFLWNTSYYFKKAEWKLHVQKANRQEPAGRKIKIYNLAFVLKMLPHFDKTFLRRECGGASVVGVYWAAVWFSYKISFVRWTNWTFLTTFYLCSKNVFFF